MITEHSISSNQLMGFICLITLLGSLIWGGYVLINWMKNDQCLKLSKLVITGERRYTINDDINKAILELRTPNTFISQDVNAIQQQIKHISWIKQVSVRKQWPNELKIHIEEYAPIAYWNDLLFLDNNGKAFSVPTERIENKPTLKLYGPEGSEQEILLGYRNINTILVADKLYLKELSVNARHSWQLKLKNNIKLELGRSDILRRLQRFIKIYPTLIRHARENSKHISYVDLRYDSGLAVKWVAS